MKMKIRKEQKLNSDFSCFWNKNYPLVLNYFIRKGIDRDDVSDLTSETFEKLYKAIRRGMQRGEYRPAEWDKLLSKIKKGILIDYWRKLDKKPYSYNYRIRDKKDEEESREIEKFLEEPDENIQKLFEENDMEGENWQKIGVLLSPHRAIHEATIINLAPTCQELKEKIREKFPFIVNRYRKRGINYEVLYKKNELSNRKLNEMCCVFGPLISRLAEKLNIDDEIGVRALKILLLSSAPWKDWYSLSRATKKKAYLSFSKNGKIYKKKTIRRPYLRFVRDYIALDKKPKGLRHFLEYEAKEKYPQYPVTIEYIKNRLKIGNAGKEILKKQLGGRKNKPGLKEKVKNYNKIIKEIINELNNS